MPLRPRVQPVQEKRIHFFAFLLSDGTWNISGQGTFPDQDSARRAWPDYRRETWAHTFCGHVPTAAEIFDGLSTRGADELRQRWQNERVDLQAVLDALDEDRAAVAAFRQRDPKGARSIGDYLDLFLSYLDRVATEADRIARSTANRYERGYPETAWGGRYGDAPRAQPRGEGVH